MKKTVLIVMASLFLAGKCRKESLTELEKLPPATQEGKNTFGCLINGMAWVPKGWDGSGPNFYIIPDPTYANGSLDIVTYRIIDGIRENLNIVSDSIKATGTYPITDKTATQFYSRNLHQAQLNTSVKYGIKRISNEMAL